MRFCLVPMDASLNVELFAMICAHAHIRGFLCFIVIIMVIICYASNHLSYVFEVVNFYQTVFYALAPKIFPIFFKICRPLISEDMNKKLRVYGSKWFCFRCVDCVCLFICLWRLTCYYTVFYLLQHYSYKLQLISSQN